VNNPALVNVRPNIIAEASHSNLSPKKVFDNYVGALADANPGSVVRTVHEPIRRPGVMRPDAVTHSAYLDGNLNHSVTIPNR
jgi:hypothetical protein